MQNTVQIKPDIIWVGGNDRRVNRFENLFPLTHGMSYNAYVILDEKTVLTDTVDRSISVLFMENVKAALNGRNLDYLVIHHMEPDHCANIEAIVQAYPNIQLIGNRNTYKFLTQFYPAFTFDNFITVKEGEELNIGKRTLRFYMTPNVHWPEVMMFYEVSEGLLFSADAFGSFATIDGNLFSDEIYFPEGIIDESRRYYVNIVGKFGSHVLKALKKFSELNITTILPLHGPIYRTPEHIGLILDAYQNWASYDFDKKSTLILYASMYGNTENAVDILASQLSQKGIREIKVYDISDTDPSYLIAEMWQYSHIVFAAPNYNGDLFYKMDALIREALRLNLKNKKVSFISNVTWGGMALKTMQHYFEDDKRFTQVGTFVEIPSAVSDETVTALTALAKDISESLIND
ncbi:FprA family A-type flavoprotein [Pseudolactococcus laudensis]|uniref:FprA family A-type flavoprotein n=1 Tax=Pseudolactococcus laudensis TaxID=1494461 RepID=UPI002FC95860